MSTKHTKATKIQYKSIEDIIRHPNGSQRCMNELIGSTGTDVVECLHYLGKDTKQSLIQACRVGNLEAVEFLLSVDTPIEDCEILFFCHSLPVFTRVLNELHSRNIDINMTKGDNVFLSLCASNKDNHIMEMYNHGVNIYAKDLIGNAISNACWGGPNPKTKKSAEARARTVQMLIDIGIKPIPDMMGNNPLHYLQGPNNVLIDVLLDSFPELRYAINNAGNTAFDEPYVTTNNTEENKYEENKYEENKYKENKYEENKYEENKYEENKYEEYDEDKEDSEYDDEEYAEEDNCVYNYTDYSESFKYLQSSEIYCC